MAHLSDGELVIRKGARNIKKLEAQVEAQRAKVNDMKAIEDLAQQIVIAPLEAELNAARARVEQHKARLAEIDARMAELNQRLAASKARAKGL